VVLLLLLLLLCLPCIVQVCGKQTGHAEVVAITFDPKVITFKDLLDVFFTVGW
jgi:peptide-methionine (S)-S-oxide reductase